MPISQKHSLDEIDHMILKILLVSPKETLKKLGAKTKLSVSACKDRKDFLIDNGYLVPRYVIGDKKIRWNNFKLIQIKLRSNTGASVVEFKEWCGKIPEIVFACTVSGGEIDGLLLIASDGGDHYEEIRSKVEKRYEIKPTISLGKTIKRYSIPAQALMPKA